AVWEVASVAPTIATITDTAGNTYAAISGTSCGTQLCITIYAAQNAKAGANAVTVNWDSAVSAGALFVDEYTGVLSSGAFDNGGNGGGQNSSAMGTGPSPASSADLIFGFGASLSGVPTALSPSNLHDTCWKGITTDGLASSGTSPSVTMTAPGTLE